MYTKTKVEYIKYQIVKAVKEFPGILNAINNKDSKSEILMNTYNAVVKIKYNDKLALATDYDAEDELVKLYTINKEYINLDISEVELYDNTKMDKLVKDKYNFNYSNDTFSKLYQEYLSSMMNDLTNFTNEDIFLEYASLYHLREYIRSSCTNTVFLDDTDSNITDEQYKHVAQLYFKPFYDDVDTAHNFNHVRDVMNEALLINKSLNLGVSNKDIIYSALAHDIFSYDERDAHHYYGSQFIILSGLTDGNLNVRLSNFTNVYNVSRAIGEHRASYKGNYTSILSEVIATADRGRPDMNHIVSRIHQCSIDPSLNFAFDPDNIPDIKLADGRKLKDFYTEYKDKIDFYTLRTLMHLYLKYSREGYIKYGELYNLMYKEELNVFLDNVDYYMENPFDFVDYIQTKIRILIK